MSSSAAPTAPTSPPGTSIAGNTVADVRDAADLHAVALNDSPYPNTKDEL
ncbi:hypothetical protein ACFY9S_27540 [Streptomyces sp. NPDC012474]